MKAFIAATAAIALLTSSAFAQGMGLGRNHARGQKAAQTHKPKVDEKAYKDALGRIGEQNACVLHAGDDSDALGLGGEPRELEIQMEVLVKDSNKNAELVSDSKASSDSLAAPARKG